MPARPGRRDSCGPRFLTTTSWLPRTSSTCSAMRCWALRITTTGMVRPVSVAAARALQQRAEPEERQRSCRPSCSAAGVGSARSRRAWPRRTISTSVDGTATVVAPQRSITTCVTAVVSGSTRRKLVPWPAAVAVSMRPPMALTSVRTTSMPMPRPASSVTCSAVVKPGVKIRPASSASVGCDAGREQAHRLALGADARQVQAGAVVAELDRDFVAFVGQRRR